MESYYNISLSAVARLRLTDSRLDEVLKMGVWRYRHNQFWLETPESFTPDGRVRPQPRLHPEDWCLEFSDRETLAGAPAFCAACSSTHLPPRTELSNIPQVSEALHQAALMAAQLKSLPPTFGQTLKALLKERGMSQRLLAATLNMDPSTVNQLINRESPVVTPHRIVAIAVALKLEPLLVDDLMAKAGLSFGHTAEGCLLSSLALAARDYSLEQCNERLEFGGYQRLTSKKGPDKIRTA